MNDIHSSAVIDPKARLGENITIGPFCHVGADVELGDGCTLHPQVTLLGPARFGPNNIFFPNCVLGADPQDLKYRGGPTRLEVGENNQFREFVTIHRGTEVDNHSGGVTRVGNNNLIMVGVHIAHDAELGNHVILANSVQIAGHVKIEDFVNVGGASALHHFVTVGRNAFVAGMTRITHDAPPYFKIEGYDQQVRGVNRTGMRRWGISEESCRALRTVFRMLYARRGERRIGQTLTEIEENGLYQTDDHVRYLVDFLQIKLKAGRYGRVREAFRNDTSADFAHFYDRRRDAQEAAT